MADFRVKVTHDKLIVGVAGQKATVLKVGPQGVKGDKGDPGSTDWSNLTNKPATFPPPPATANTLGGVIIGANLSITGNGVLSANIPSGGVTAFNNRTGNVTLTANDVTAVANGIYQANGSYLAETLLTSIPTSFGNQYLSGLYYTRSSAPGFPFVAGSVLIGSRAIVGVTNANDPCNIEFIPGDTFNEMRFRSYNKSLVIGNDGFFVESGTANWTWSANSILTQGRADSRYQATGNYLNDVTTSVNTTYGTDVVNGLKKSGGFTDFVAGKLSLASYGLVGVVTGNETCGIEFRTGNTFSSLRIRQYAHTLVVQNTGFEVETGTANWTWSANSILTQGRGDARYQATGSYLTSANLTWGNITGKPTFANVATSGNYTDLANTPNLSLYYLASNPTGYITSACLTYSNITGTPNLSLYQLVSTNTWANLTGKPTLATVATSGNYTDLTNTPNLSLYLTTANAASTYLPSANFSFSNLTGKPTTLSGYGITDGLTSATAAATYLPSANFTYANIAGTIPTATNTTLGAIKVGSNLTIANGVLSANVPAGGGGFQNGDILNGGTW